MLKKTLIRVLSSLVAVLLLMAVVIAPVPVLIGAIGIISLLMVYEFCRAFKLSLPVCITAMVFCLLLQWQIYLKNTDAAIMIIFAYIWILTIYAVFRHNTFKIPDLISAFFAPVYIGVPMMCIGLTRGFENGIYPMFLIFVCAWLSDTGAYFVGSFLGKHKLCPTISPKKTVEGAIGGVFGSVIGAVVLALIAKAHLGCEVNYIFFAILGIFGSILGQLGDLLASLIKRHCDIKDFGNIMPGHGGGLDRFDSVLFIAPYIYYIIYFMDKLGFYIFS